jgi:ribosomal protein L13E
MSVREDLSVQGQKRSRESGRGSGFSQAELRKAGITAGWALHAGFPIDVRRRISHHENVKLAQERVRRVSPLKKPASKAMTTSSANS